MIRHRFRLRPGAEQSASQFKRRPSSPLSVKSWATIESEKCLVNPDHSPSQRSRKIQIVSKPGEVKSCVSPDSQRALIPEGCGLLGSNGSGGQQNSRQDFPDGGQASPHQQETRRCPQGIAEKRIRGERFAGVLDRKRIVAPLQREPAFKNKGTRNCRCSPINPVQTS
jgi:hypothetical protein